VQNHKDWDELYKKLKMLQDSKIDTTMNDLKETADKADRLKDDIKGDLANA